METDPNIRRITRQLLNYDGATATGRGEIDLEASLITNALADRDINRAVLRLGELARAFDARGFRADLVFDEAGRLLRATQEGREVTGQDRADLEEQNRLRRQVTGHMGTIAATSNWHANGSTIRHGVIDMEEMARQNLLTPAILNEIERQGRASRTVQLESPQVDVAQNAPDGIPLRFPVADVVSQITGSPLPGVSVAKSIV